MRLLDEAKLSDWPIFKFILGSDAIINVRSTFFRGLSKNMGLGNWPGPYRRLSEAYIFATVHPICIIGSVQIGCILSFSKKKTGCPPWSLYQSVNLKQLQSGLRGKLVTTREIPQVEEIGHSHLCFTNTPTARHLSLARGVTAASLLSHYCYYRIWRGKVHCLFGSLKLTSSFSSILFRSVSSFGGTVARFRGFPEI